VAHRFDEPDSEMRIHLDNVTVFVGTESQARSLALRDTNEFVVTEITAWRGNPNSKNTLLFLVTFADGSQLWQPVGGKATDISRTQAFAKYCADKPMLSPLLHTKDDANTPRAAANASPMPLKATQKVFVNLRYLSHTLYQYREYDLERKYEVDYLIPAFVQSVTKNRAKIYIPLTDHVMDLNKFDIGRYVSETAASDAIIVDEALMRKHQCIISLQLPHDWDTLSPEETMGLMDTHTDAVLNTIHEHSPSASTSVSLAGFTSIHEPNDEARTPITFFNYEDTDHEYVNITYNGDTPSNASTAASSWMSDTPSVRDFEDYEDFPSPNDPFDAAGMEALLEYEFQQDMLLLANLELHSSHS
jgi:hypothetical protein